MLSLHDTSLGRSVSCIVVKRSLTLIYILTAYTICLRIQTTMHVYDISGRSWKRTLKTFSTPQVVDVVQEMGL